MVAPTLHGAVDITILPRRLSLNIGKLADFAVRRVKTTVAYFVYVEELRRCIQRESRNLPPLYRQPSPLI